MKAMHDLLPSSAVYRLQMEQQLAGPHLSTWPSFFSVMLVIDPPVHTHCRKTRKHIQVITVIQCQEPIMSWGQALQVYAILKQACMHVTTCWDGWIRLLWHMTAAIICIYGG